MNLFDKMRQQKLFSTAVMLFTLSVGILIGTLVNTKVDAAKGQAVAPDATPLVVPKAAEIGNEFTKLAKKLDPSVVNIAVEVSGKATVSATRGRGQQPQGDDEDDDGQDLLRRFFGNRGGGGGIQIPQQAQKREQTGTGFIVDKNGYIITNNHVVEGGDKIRVKIHGDSNEYRARVIGTDKETDLAVIKIESRKGLVPVSIGNSDAVQVGDWAVAIGSPFGLEATVTAGIVSATGRNNIGGAFQSFIQTDAAINPGNSGGPLLNIKGEVIGVNTMIATRAGGSEGVGFALPVNTVARVYNNIIQDGRVTRGSIGITFQPDTKPETLKALGVDHGVIVSEVKKGGPADKGGMKAEDIIVAVNGQAVHDQDDFRNRIADLPVGTPATLSVDRDGKKVDLKITIEDRTIVFSDRPEIAGENVLPDSSKQPETTDVKFGIGLRGLTEQEKEVSPEHRGIAVARVESDSFAEEIGMQAGDIILAINRQPVNSLDDVRKIQQKLHGGDAVAFLIARPQAGLAGRRGAPAGPAPSQYLSGKLPEK
jgi:serine protease Do